MTRHEPFGQCLQRILRQEGWSATKLVGLLGYKSRNSLFRILKDQASYEAQAAFLESLRGADVPWLASYEAKLEDALELRRVGLREFLDNRSLLTLLRSAPAQTEDIAVDPVMDSQTKTFAQLLAEYAQGESVGYCCATAVMRVSCLRSIRPYVRSRLLAPPLFCTSSCLKMKAWSIRSCPFNRCSTRPAMSPLFWNRMRPPQRLRRSIG